MAKRRGPPPPRPEWAYFVDIDGTLIEIAESPDAARLDPPLVALVERLHRACGGALALVSGRALADLDRRLGGLPVPVAGQHGLERRDADGRLHGRTAPAAALAELRDRLASLPARHPGLLLEDKGLSLALHYRQAPVLAGYVHRVVGELLAAVGGGIQLQKGKRVVELKPFGVDKGSAIEAFLAEPPFAGRRPVFIGDDITDENGFAVVNRRGGVSIKVGVGRSCAPYRLADVDGVRRWLAVAAGERA